MQPKNELTFANKNRQPFDWNAKIDNNALVEPEPPAFPVIPTEMPWVDIAQNSPTQALKDEEDNAIANQAAENANLQDNPHEVVQALEDEIAPTAVDDNTNNGIFPLGDDKIPGVAPQQVPIVINDDNTIVV